MQQGAVFICTQEHQGADRLCQGEPGKNRLRLLGREWLHITARWNAEITAILHSAEMKERMTPEGLEVPDTSSEYFRKVLRRDIGKWSKVIKDARIQIAQ